MSTQEVDMAAIELLGRLLYGDVWIPALARELKVSDSLVRKVARGERRIPESLRADLARLVDRERIDMGRRAGLLTSLAVVFDCKSKDDTQ